MCSHLPLKLVGDHLKTVVALVRWHFVAGAIEQPEWISVAVVDSEVVRRMRLNVLLVASANGRGDVAVARNFVTVYSCSVPFSVDIDSRFARLVRVSDVAGRVAWTMLG